MKKIEFRSDSVFDNRYWNGIYDTTDLLLRNRFYWSLYREFETRLELPIKRIAVNELTGLLNEAFTHLILVNEKDKI